MEACSPTRRNLYIGFKITGYIRFKCKCGILGWEKSFSSRERQASSFYRNASQQIPTESVSAWGSGNGRTQWKSASQQGRESMKARSKLSCLPFKSKEISRWSARDKFLVSMNLWRKVTVFSVRRCGFHRLQGPFVIGQENGCARCWSCLFSCGNAETLLSHTRTAVLCEGGCRCRLLRSSALVLCWSLQVSSSSALRILCLPRTQSAGLWEGAGNWSSCKQAEPERRKS